MKSVAPGGQRFFYSAASISTNMDAKIIFLLTIYLTSSDLPVPEIEFGADGK